MHRKIYPPNTSHHIDIVSALGLKNEWLNEVGLRALQAYTNTTSHDAVTAPGSYAYFAAVRAMRDVLCPEGWEQLVRNGLELTGDHENKVSIIIASGDKYTGIEFEGKSPRTKNEKGNQIKKIVFYNANQLRLPTMERKVKIVSDQKTWIFLFHIDTSKKEMRYELSLPITMDFENLRVAGWDKRIIFPPIDYRNIPQTTHDQVSLQEYKVEIQRK